MLSTLAIFALGAASVASAQGVTALLTPTAAAPAGCATDFAGSFEITVVLPPAQKKRDIVERQSAACASDGTLVATLAGSVLTDAKGRTGAIVANHQFQFDGPPQDGSIFTGGFSVCQNGSLALGGSSVFFQCQSGSFFNLYDESTGAQCSEVLIDVIPCTAGAAAADPPSVSQSSDGQPIAVTQASDAQPQAPSATTLVTQISDGQPQAASAQPVSQFTDGQIQVTALPSAVSQISDGQVQATGAASQISDGQVQASGAASQISDGQVQASGAASQATDGQVQVSSAAPVSQATDGQVQATTAAPVSQATDGQPQVTASATSAPAQFTGGASLKAVGAQFAVGAAGVLAVAML